MTYKPHPTVGAAGGIKTDVVDSVQVEEIRQTNKLLSLMLYHLGHMTGEHISIRDVDKHDID